MLGVEGVRLYIELEQIGTGSVQVFHLVLYNVNGSYKTKKALKHIRFNNKYLIYSIQNGCIISLDYPKRSHNLRLEMPPFYIRRREVIQPNQ